MRSIWASKAPSTSFALRPTSTRSKIMLSAAMSSTMSCPYEVPQDIDNGLFEYTSGRWIFNEDLRRNERRLKFNLAALKESIAEAVHQPSTNVVSITKLAEGGFNRILEATMADKSIILARIPYPNTVPRMYAVANEVATLEYLRLHNIPVPKVLGYAATADNPVGAEYILMEKMGGISLGDIWFSMSNKERLSIIKQLIELEKLFFELQLPASGSIYFQEDLRAGEKAVAIEAASVQGKPFVIGPTAQYEWWYQEREQISTNRGPWIVFRDVLEAVAKREKAWCERFGKPRQHVERYVRELYEFRLLSPQSHIDLLSDYLKLAPYLDIPAGNPLTRPTLRHPDLSPNNILVSHSKQVVGVIDWQHSVVLPLCLVAGVPKHFQNWGDPVSDRLAKPETQLPDNFATLNANEQNAIRETQRRRLVHFLYAANTMQDIPEHYDAFTNASVRALTRLYDRAGAPWEGDSVSLKAAIIETLGHWPLSLDGNAVQNAQNSTQEAPVKYSETEIVECLALDAKISDRMQELEEMRDTLGIDALGWVPNDERYEASKTLARTIKAGMLECSETALEKAAVEDHFPFDDHDEGD